MGSAGLVWALWMPVAAALFVPWWCAARPVPARGRAEGARSGFVRRHGFLMVLFLAGSALVFGLALGTRSGALAFACLVAESLALVAIVSALRSTGAPRTLAQTTATLLGLAACLTPLWTNPLIRATDGRPAGQREVVRFAIAANPVLVAANSAAGIDLPHGPRTYHLSLLGSLFYEYPSWAAHAGALAGGALLLTLTTLWLRRRKA